MSRRGNTRSLALAAALALVGGTAVLGLASSAAAATTAPAAAPAATQAPNATKTPTVTIHVGSNAPGTVVVPSGRTVTFVNDSLFMHTLTSTTKNWTFTQGIAGGGSYTFPKALTANGTYSFGGSGGLDAMNGTLSGNARVGPAPTATATPKPSGSASPAPSTPASSAPRPTSASSPAPAPVVGAPTPTPTAGVTGSGQAVPYLDPLTGQTVPFGAAGQPSAGVQQPSVAGELTPSAADPQASAGSSSAPSAAYASSNRGVIGSSPHKYGLPTLVAFVAIVGVASLLVRVLLAEPLPPRP